MRVGRMALLSKKRADGHQKAFGHQMGPRLTRQRRLRPLSVLAICSRPARAMAPTQWDGAPLNKHSAAAGGQAGLHVHPLVTDKVGALQVYLEVPGRPQEEI